MGESATTTREHACTSPIWYTPVLSRVEGPGQVGESFPPLIKGDQGGFRAISPGPSLSKRGNLAELRRTNSPLCQRGGILQSCAVSTPPFVKGGQGGICFPLEERGNSGDFGKSPLAPLCQRGGIRQRGSTGDFEDASVRWLSQKIFQTAEKGHDRR